ncbi:hypothetical protein B0H17DRAFT_1335719 [Mycena rosella]|uniref:Uncharacterized protein n=1 Tax=Mycena rosella TaxID=1033263 RepID=A0AAD7D1Z2_MYCRO|nr:hypothetical protein B0H17DRAFT_1335719 [Mycena rosella]
MSERPSHLACHFTGDWDLSLFSKRLLGLQELVVHFYFTPAMTRNRATGGCASTPDLAPELPAPFTAADLRDGGVPGGSSVLTRPSASSLECAPLAVRRSATLIRGADVCTSATRTPLARRASCVVLGFGPHAQPLVDAVGSLRRRRTTVSRARTHTSGGEMQRGCPRASDCGYLRGHGPRAYVAVGRRGFGTCCQCGRAHTSYRDVEDLRRFSAPARATHP